MFYDEVDVVISAAKYLRRQPFIDETRLYVAGLSTGGTLTMLTALTYPHFRAAASFSGSPDAVGYTRHAVAIGAESDVPFDYRDARELQLRSARALLASNARTPLLRDLTSSDLVVVCSSLRWFIQPNLLVLADNPGNA